MRFIMTVLSILLISTGVLFFIDFIRNYSYDPEGHSLLAKLLAWAIVGGMPLGAGIWLYRKFPPVSREEAGVKNEAVHVRDTSFAAAPKPSSRVRAEIYVEKRKVFLSLLGFVPLALLAWAGMSIFDVDYRHPFVAAGFTIVFYAAFTRKLWPMLWQTPHVKVYDNGIDFAGLGFWEWENIGGVFDGEKHHFRLNVKGRSVPTKSSINMRQKTGKAGRKQGH